MSIELNGTSGIQFNDGSDQSTAATPYGRKNLIINGDMRIAQRGTSATNVNTGYFTMDRWQSGANFGSFDFAQSTDVPTGQGFANSFKADCNTSATPTGSNEAYIEQKIEGQNLQHLKFGTSSAESITISFWVKSNKTGTYSVWLFQPDVARDAALPYTINSANTWVKKTITFAGDTSGGIDNNNGSGLEVRFYLGTGPDLQGTCDGVWNGTFTERYPSGGVNIMDSTANEWLITGIQLEIGDSASTFEFMPYDMELARCQRYYEKSWNDKTAIGSTGDTGSYMFLTNRNPGNGHTILPFKVKKRANATVSLYAPNSGNVGYGSNLDAGGVDTGLLPSRIGESGATVYTTSSIALGNFIQFHYVADAEL